MVDDLERFAAQFNEEAQRAHRHWVWTTALQIVTAACAVGAIIVSLMGQKLETAKKLIELPKKEQREEFLVFLEDPNATTKEATEKVQRLEDQVSTLNLEAMSKLRRLNDLEDKLVKAEEKARLAEEKARRAEEFAGLRCAAIERAQRSTFTPPALTPPKPALP